MFNNGDYQERLHRGELVERINPGGNGLPNPKLRLPAGTRSQIVSYVDQQGITVAIVHQYLRPDGTLAASGKPDPKFLLEAGQRYALDTRPRRSTRGRRRRRRT